MTRSPNSMEWMAWQVLLQRAPVDVAHPPKPINPKPPGQPCHGGAAEAVLLWLQDRRSRGVAYWSLHQIIRGTGRSGKACCWAVLYLYRIGAIERTRDGSHGRYLQYRATRGEQ